VNNDLTKVDLQWFAEGDTPPANEGSPAWMAQLPDDYKQDEGLSKFATIGDFAKDYKDKAGKVASFEYAPENEADYEFDKVKMPEGSEFTDEGDAAVRAMAKKAGLTKAQAKSVYSWLEQTVIAEDTKNKEAAETKKAEAKAAREKLTAGLKAEFGDNYPAKIELAKRAMKTFADVEFHKVLEETLLPDGTKLGDSPGMIKAMVNIAEKIGEDVLGPGAPGVPKDQNAILNEAYPSMKDMPERNEF